MLSIGKGDGVRSDVSSRVPGLDPLSPLINVVPHLVPTQSRCAIGGVDK
jgi:hypothetical protein